MENVNATRLAKEAEVAKIKESFENAIAAVLVDFRGTTVETITELRARFRAKGVEYRVVKNNLVKKALEGTPLAENDEFLKALAGPTAIAWSFEDPSTAAKVIKDFRKEGDAHEKLTVKCGVLENEVFVGERVEKELATLPGKDEIRAMLLAQLLAPAQSLVRQLSAPAQNFAYVLDALVREKGGE